MKRNETFSYQQMAESDLFERLKSDDEMAFNEVYRRFEHFLSFTAFQVLKDSDQVKDVLQDFFVDFWANKRYLKINNNFRGYAYKAVRNNSIDIKRKLRHDEESIAQSATHQDHMVEAEIEDEPNAYGRIIDQIPQLLTGISGQQRRIIELYVMGGLRRKQVAAMMGISENSAKTHLNAAIKSLRSTLTSQLISLLLAILMNYYFK